MQFSSSVNSRVSREFRVVETHRHAAGKLQTINLGRDRNNPLTSRFERKRAESAVQRPEYLAVGLLSTRVSFHQDALCGARIRNLPINQIKRK